MARRGIFRRIADALGITRRERPEPAPEPAPKPKPKQPPKQPPRGGQPIGDKRRPGGRGGQPKGDRYEQEAQRVWDEVASDVANNVEMEEPFVKFIADRLRKWAENGFMETKEVRSLISWLIINSGVYITHEDITAILDRIYEAMFQAV